MYFAAHDWTAIKFVAASTKLTTWNDFCSDLQQLIDLTQPTGAPAPIAVNLGRSSSVNSHDEKPLAAESTWDARNPDHMKRKAIR